MFMFFLHRKQISLFDKRNNNLYEFKVMRLQIFEVLRIQKRGLSLFVVIKVCSADIVSIL